MVVGAVELRALCLQLERLGRDGRAEEAAALVAAVREAFARADTALAALVERE